MRICPLALMSGHTYYCNRSCAFSSDGECLLAAVLKEYSDKTIDTEPAVKREAKFAPPRIDESVLFSNKEYRQNLKEEGF